MESLLRPIGSIMVAKHHLLGYRGEGQTARFFPLSPKGAEQALLGKDFRGLARELTGRLRGFHRSGLDAGVLREGAADDSAGVYRSPAAVGAGRDSV